MFLHGTFLHTKNLFQKAVTAIFCFNFLHVGAGCCRFESCVLRHNGGLAQLAEHRYKLNQTALRNLQTREKQKFQKSSTKTNVRLADLKVPDIRVWWNWQTRQTQDLVPLCVRVQVSSPGPTTNLYQRACEIGRDTLTLPFLLLVLLRQVKA